MDLEFLENKTLLVTGATGLLGTCIIEWALRARQVKVIAMGRTLSKLVTTFRHLLTTKNLHLVEHDISQPIPREVGHVDYIFHGASPISGQVIDALPVDVIQSNLSGTLNCLEYLKGQQCGKMIIFSSATVYAQSSHADVEVTESQTQVASAVDAANAPYSESKRMIEVIAKAYHKQYGIDVLIARFSYLYGYSVNPARTAFYEFICKALHGGDIIMNKSGLPRRDNIYVDDAVEALFHLCQTGSSGEAFNISSCGEGGNFASIDEIAEIIAHEANVLFPQQNVRVTYLSKSAKRLGGIRLNNAKLKATGWKLSTSLEEGIRTTLKQYSENI